MREFMVNASSIRFNLKCVVEQGAWSVYFPVRRGATRQNNHALHRGATRLAGKINVSIGLWRLARLVSVEARPGAEISDLEGAGIKLANTWRFVEMLHGCIHAGSQYGAGSAFCIDLPVEAGTSPELRQEI